MTTPPFLQPSSWPMEALLLHRIYSLYHWTGHHNSSNARLPCGPASPPLPRALLFRPPLPGGPAEGRPGRAASVRGRETIGCALEPSLIPPSPSGTRTTLNHHRVRKSRRRRLQQAPQPQTRRLSRHLQFVTHIIDFRGSPYIRIKRTRLFELQSWLLYK